MSEQVDIVVLGLGVGGEEAGRKLAEAGLSVVGVEHGLVGGECAYWGCIPTKTMVRAAALLVESRRADGFAGRVDVEPAWGPVAARIREAALDWDDTARAESFATGGGRLVRGRGRLAGPGRVEVDGHTYEATTGVVLATGTAPAVPPIDGLADTPYWTSREAVTAEALPASLIVLGGGFVGVEFAQVYARFGVAVTLVEAEARLLPTEEQEASEVALEALAADGVDVRLSTRATSVTHGDGRFRVSLGEDGTATAERLLVAVGRRSDLEALGVGSVGLDPAAPFVKVDDRMRAAERLWAVGDVTGHGTYTHTALYQAGVAVRDILGQVGPPADYHAEPRVVFTDPEIAAVGLTEADARRSGIHTRAGVARGSLTIRGAIHGAGSTELIKLVVDDERGVLVGATAAGPAGGEVLSALALAVHAQVPVNALRHMIYAYPTFHRGIESALQDLGTVG